MPPGEDRETYLVRVSRTTAALRDAEVLSPLWTYAPAMRAEDGSGPVEIAVAQLSDRWAPSPFRSLVVSS